MIEMMMKVEYNRGVIIERPLTKVSFFLLSKTSYTVIINKARDVIGSTAKADESLDAHPITDRAYFFGPYTTKNGYHRSANLSRFSGVTL